LKTALYPERKKKVLQEAKFRNSFIDHNLDFIPAPVDIDSKIFPNGAVIYEYIEGTKPKFQNQNEIKQISRIISSIHQTKYNTLDNGWMQIGKLYDFLNSTTQRISKTYASLVNPSIESAFNEALNEIQTRFQESKGIKTIGINADLHGDLSDNFIIDPEGKIWLVDWENSEFGDVLDELTWFLYCNDIPKNQQSIFFQEYQNNFSISKDMKFELLTPIYFMCIPVFNICWGINQLDTNIKYKLEPERKIRDLLTSAQNWKQFYSDSTCLLIEQGIRKIRIS
jgi:thiamine kinase-like enzyme